MDHCVSSNRNSNVVGLLGADVESVYLEGSEMKIEKTGEYRMRDGRKAVIVSLNGNTEFSAIGYYVDDDNTHEQDCWTLDGEWLEEEETGCDIVGEYTEPKPPQYVPYTWEDREQLRGRWYLDRDDGSQSMVCILHCADNCFFINNRDTAEFLENCEWLDGTPCGKVVAE
jgi:hypothetical protein